MEAPRGRSRRRPGLSPTRHFHTVPHCTAFTGICTSSLSKASPSAQALLGSSFGCFPGVLIRVSVSHYLSPDSTLF